MHGLASLANEGLLASELDAGRQAYWVCPLIEASDALDESQGMMSITSPLEISR